MSTSEAPPPYQKKQETPAVSSTNPARVERNGIPVSERRSMEDLARPLPEGWIRQMDANTGHHFYVDLRGPTPKSTWEHPASDYPAEPSRDSIEAESTDEDDRHLPPPSSSSNQNRTTANSTSTSGKPPPTGLKKFGRNIKDKMTGSTHEERKAKRKQREEEERRAYQQHVAIRQAIMKAAQTGQPQLLGHDRQGKEVWVKPPPQVGYGYDPMGGYGARGFGPGTYAAPGYPYGGRRAGMGYGGGFGGGGMFAPTALGLGGGLLLGAALF